ncbi:hypothetical protein NDN08_005498 [Rhodosorus marinus]|uniref:RWP-RK domain-containing protein n=1 Tax=Rhodosorus marinus TaxID=101924 RepID=A0AAV8V1S9_9RHOD|nr:hypothetical protein NDN08_005498 [Rhodosorus marinus]
MVPGIETRNVEISPQSFQYHHGQSQADRKYPKESKPEGRTQEKQVRGRQYEVTIDPGEKSPSHSSEQGLEGSSRAVRAEEGSQAPPVEQKISRRLRSRAIRNADPEAGDGRRLQGLNAEVKEDAWDIYGESDGDVDSLTVSSRTWPSEISTTLFKGTTEACHAGLSHLELLELELEGGGAGQTSIFKGDNEELVCSLMDYNGTEENEEIEETPKNIEQGFPSFLDCQPPEPTAEDELTLCNVEPTDLCDHYLRKQVPLNALESFSQLVLSVMNESEHENLVQTRLKSLSSKVKRTSKYSNANVTVNDLSPLFGLTREVLASEIGVGLTITKKLIRKVGISRWPCRKYRQWQRKLKSVVARHQKSLAANEQSSTLNERYKASMEKLKRNYIYDLRGVLPD